MIKMNAQDVVNHWLHMLRSDNYAQTAERLHDDDGYCCLGLLVHADGNYEWHDAADCYAITDSNGYTESAVLPEETSSKYGLDKTITESELEYLNTGYELELMEPAIHERQGILSTLNDRGSTFQEIADFIEEMGWDHVE